jgi:predicted amidohydrolase YtcJ
LILVGGTIYTANPTQPKAEALAIAGEFARGTRQDVEALRGLRREWSIWRGRP